METTEVMATIEDVLDAMTASKMNGCVQHPDIVSKEILHQIQDMGIECEVIHHTEQGVMICVDLTTYRP